MKCDEAWIRWPTTPCWIAFARYGALLTLLWIIAYGGASFVTSLHSYRVRLYVDADLAIPFVPATSVIYLSLFPMLWLAPFVLHTSDRLREFARSLAILFICSAVGFLLLPSNEMRNTPPPDGFIGRIFGFADWLNLSYNYLPSLHVGMAVLCAETYARNTTTSISGLLWAWAAAILLSTLLTHQHYIMDVVAGAGLALLIGRGIRL